MSYETIDPILTRWAQATGQTLQTLYKDSEVRSFEVYGNGGKKFQLWIDPPSGKYVEVHAWDYRKRRADWKPTLDELDTALNAALTQIRRWCGQG